MKPRIAMIAVLVWALGSAACGKPDMVKFEPYDESAITMAKTLGTPVVIYATADW